MADTAKRVVGPQLLTASAATYYTVPASTVTILRSIQAVNVTTSNAALTLSIGTDAAGTRLYAATPIVGNGVLVWTGFMVLTAAEILQAYSSVASALTLIISGVEVA